MSRHSRRQPTAPAALVLSCLFALSAGVLPGLVPAASADLVSRFDAGNESWAAVDYPFRSQATAPRTTGALPYDAATGNPAGSVRISDVFAETGIAAPAAWLGNRGGSYGGTLTYDIIIRFSDNVIYPAVVLASPTLSVYYDAPSPPVGAWQSRSVPLTEAGWKIGGTNAAPTQAQFLALLQSLSGLYIYTEWNTGADDTNVDNIVLTSAATPVAPPAPAGLALGCFPNPFNPQTTVRFTLPGAAHARLVIVDVAGRAVRTLTDADLPAGTHEARWDGRDQAGRAVATGCYLARLESGGEVAVTRLALVR
jgi:hypothetical protein